MYHTPSLRIGLRKVSLIKCHPALWTKLTLFLITGPVCIEKRSRIMLGAIARWGELYCHTKCGAYCLDIIDTPVYTDIPLITQTLSPVLITAGFFKKGIVCCIL